METQPPAVRRPAAVLTFLIADIRGYTTFTQKQGDEAAARLAGRFAEIAREGVDAHGGDLIELRGDEALAVFASAREALRTAVDLQLTFADEIEIDPSLPLRVGIGLDAGEAVPYGDGYRGGALNLAARLCSQAASGEVLASQGVVHLARAVEGVGVHEHGTIELKGLSEPVRIFRAAPLDLGPDALAARFQPDGVKPPVVASELPTVLDPVTPIVGRDADVRRIRWAWRAARRGQGAVVVVTGPSGIGKTRLAAEGARTAADNGAEVVYVSFADSQGDDTSAAEAAFADDAPAFLVFDDLESASSDDLRTAVRLAAQAPGSRKLVLAAFDDERASADLLAAARKLAGEERTLRPRPLGLDELRQIAALYLGDALEALPSGLLEASGGVPQRLHEQVADWARAEAARRLGTYASEAAAGRTDLRSAEERLANSVVDLQLVEEQARLFGAGLSRGAAEAFEAPYKGLTKFETDDADWFFGRERLVAEMIARLAGAPFLGVVGPSGSGKSSAVRAGLVPAVRSNVLPGSERWTIAVMRPGERPLRELDRTLWGALPKHLLDKIGDSEFPLRAARDALSADERLMLVVDQFEEVFSLCDDERERAAFLAALSEAARDPRGNEVLVVALRADYYGRFATDPGLAELLGRNHVLVGPMSADEYRRAIEQPALRAGVRIEPALVDELVSEVLGEPGALPLLSTALLELWQHREGRTLRHEAYGRTGGVRAAVAQLAEDAYGRLSPEQQQIARSIMLRLAGGEGDAVVRRRVPLSDFDTGVNDDVGRVLAVLTGNRLLTVNEGTVEVAHEALLREWPRLREWIEEDAVGRRLHLHLMQAAREWAGSGRDTEELYRGARLTSALDWTAAHTLELNELEREFLGTSRTASEAEAERQRRTNRRLRGLLAGVAALLVAALVAGAFALLLRQRAERETTRAIAQRLGAQALVQKDLDRSLLLAREAVNIDDSLVTRGNLLAGLVRSPAAIGIMRPLRGRLLYSTLSPDGHLLAVGNNNPEAALIDVRTRKVIRTLPSDGVFFGADGKTYLDLQLHEGPERLVVRDLQTGRRLKVIPKEPGSFWFTKDFARLVVAEEDGRVAVIRDTSDNRVVERIPAPRGRFFWDVFIFDHNHLLTIETSGPESEDCFFGDCVFQWWDVRTKRVLQSFLVSGGFAGYAMSYDGSLLAVGKTDGSVSVYDLRTGARRDMQGRHNAAGANPWFSPNGRLLGSGGDDKQVLLWDVASGNLVQTLTGHNGRVFSPSFSPDDRTMYTTSLDGSVIVWDLAGDRRLGQPFDAGAGNDVPEDPSAEGLLAVSPTGDSFAVTQANGEVVLYNARTLREERTIRAVDGRLFDAAFSPDGRMLATAGADGSVGLWNVATGRPVHERLPGPPRMLERGPNSALSVAFSPDGKTLTAGDLSLRIYFWDVASGRLKASPLKAPKDPALPPDLGLSAPGTLGIEGLAFSPDGGKLAVGHDSNATVFSLPSRQAMYTVDVDGDYGRAAAVAFSPDGSLLATGGGTGDVRFWDAKTGARKGRSVSASAGWVENLDFDPAGLVLVSAGTDGTTRLIDVDARVVLGAPLPGADNVHEDAAFTPDGKRVFVVYGSGDGYVWDVTREGWKRQACAVAGRNLTRDEWDEFVPERSYGRVCPGA